MLRYRIRETERTYFPRPEGMSAALHALLIQRGISSAEEAERFLHPTQAQLHDPMLLSDMAEAVALIRGAVERGEPICVYGDYDVDGVSASTILSGALRSMGAQVEVYLPSRHTEGYGLNEAAIRSIAQRNKLLVTVDCGVTAVELIALAKSLGMTCVVTDHHELAEELPDCPVVDPLRNDYPCACLCGGGVAFKLVQALLGTEAALEYVDIAALATVADVVKLVDENRVIVKLGLERMNQNPRPGLKTLIETAGLGDRTIDAVHIAFQLGPRLNSAGRLGAASRAYNLLNALDEHAALPIAQELEAENTARKDVEQQILTEAEAQLVGFDFLAHRALVLAGKDWNPGVVGLVAGRLQEKYHYPVILLSEHDGVLTGSCRSIPGVDIHAALTAVKQHLVRYGGHKQAAGLTLNRSELEAFRDDLNRWLAENIPANVYIPDEEYDMEIHFSELTTAFVQELEAIAPTGYGNPAPIFRTTAIPVDARGVGRDGAHLKLTLSEGGVQRGGIFFGHGAMADRMPQQADALFAPELNTFMGRTDVQLKVKALKSGDALAEISGKIDGEDELLHDFLTEMLYNRRINPSENPPRTIGKNELTDLVAENPQGTLILTADLSQTGMIAHLLSPALPDVSFRALPDDPRRFNALVAYPPVEIPGGWRRVILAGVPGELSLPEGCEVLRLEMRPAWINALPDVDGMREVYKSLRRLSQRPVRCDSLTDLCDRLSTDTKLGLTACAASALALHDMQLITLTLDRSPIAFKLNPMRKTEPESSAVWRQIQKWRNALT